MQNLHYLVTPYNKQKTLIKIIKTPSFYTGGLSKLRAWGCSFVCPLCAILLTMLCNIFCVPRPRTVVLDHRVTSCHPCYQQPAAATAAVYNGRNLAQPPLVRYIAVLLNSTSYNRHWDFLPKLLTYFYSILMCPGVLWTCCSLRFRFK